MIVAWLLKNWIVVAVAMAAVAASYAATLHYGRLLERADWETNILQKSVQLLRDRRDTNEELKRATDADLCLSLGRLPDPEGSGECL